MAQKINPTALRLEKTNAHHKSCWYSDHYYSDQLQNNYKICNYIESIFNKIKRCEPAFFIKALPQRNQIFCFFPKKRRPFRAARGWTIRRGEEARQGAPYKSQQGESTTLQAKKHGCALLQGLPSVEWIFYALCLRMKSDARPIGVPREGGSGALQRNDGRGDFAGRVAASLELFAIPHGTGTIIYSTLLQALVFRGLSQLGGQGAAPLAGKKCAHRMRIGSRISDGTFGAPPERLGSVRPEGKDISPVERSAKTYLYPVKVPFVQQSSEFLAQKVCRALAQRMAFGRLRRQILWDVKVSRYVKGVRVSCSGRVESKSKKAQKARTRTFQWGQTELHVFSSLVQFTSKALLTPFGKIGVKVWVCYGFN